MSSSSNDKNAIPSGKNDIPNKGKSSQKEPKKNTSYGPANVTPSTGTSQSSSEQFSERHGALIGGQEGGSDGKVEAEKNGKEEVGVEEEKNGKGEEGKK
ncbi:hypothetical protein EKO04_002239 [Ascochyta lentis]|uniref:Uncharacterized protein n=1 Tax=Ascochyta lentis TaxID=205686 RepID=A0A8H7JB72_9PLEO|nr:hypothetical protein EKO04_002239 [Ascochyta lentis]